MGLKEKQAMDELQNKTITRYTKRLTEHGLTIGLDADWESVPGYDVKVIDRVQAILSQFTNHLVSLSENAIAKEEVIKQIKKVVLCHDSSGADEYAYALSLADGTLAFKANLQTFTFASTSKKQPGLKGSIESLL